MSRTHQSLSTALLRPGIAGGTYPQRTITPESVLDIMFHRLAGPLRHTRISRQQMDRRVESIKRYSKEFAKKMPTEITGTARKLRGELHRWGLTDTLINQAFALIREASSHAVGMRHFDCQLLGGLVMLHGGVVEMETGEGKTLAAALPAATAALAGIPVYVLTVNDHLVDRDAKQLAPLYEMLGLRVDAVTSTMNPPQRKQGYSADITYCTAKQLAFDYLRDRLRLEDRETKAPETKNALFLRGLCYAIIDEADSILIDEARTPLIISRQGMADSEEETYRLALDLAEQLALNIDFHVEQSSRQIRLSDCGQQRLEELTAEISGPFGGRQHRQELVRMALSALHFYQRDRHYLVKDNRIAIIDEHTGRLMADRAWERGLHQLIELKENCPVTGPRQPLARLTYQRFFRRFLHLSGMTGTAWESRNELWSVYHLPVIRVPTNNPSQRLDHGTTVSLNQDDKWQAVVSRCRALSKQGRPVLIGTRSIADSELLSTLLTNAHITHQVLNARQDSREAEIIALAGLQGNVTVATNMAGRGTDIPLGEGVADLGGLHVISCELNDSQRVDRQLIGRCGRQGDAGSYESIYSLTDELFTGIPLRFQRIIQWLVSARFVGSKTLTLRCMRLCQQNREREHRQMRRDLLQYEQQLSKLLAYTGKME